jgi:hypothetical protein
MPVDHHDCNRMPLARAWLRFSFGVMLMSAKFRVDAVFTIEGRGTVLQGAVVSGQVGSGMQVGVDRPCRIVAVEAIHGREISPGSVGLVLDASASPTTGTVLDIT